MDKQLRRWADGWTVGKPLEPKPETKAAKIQSDMRFIKP